MSPQRLSNLREKLVAVFSVEELTTLCADFSLEYDGLPGQSKEAKTRELLALLDRKNQVEALIAYCKKARPNVDWREVLEAAEAESPYKGLEYFGVADAAIFFGREQLTAKLIGRLRTSRFLAVIGASGSGKSSLVRAGLVASLLRGEPLADGAPPLSGITGEHTHIVTPTDHPLKALAASLTRDSESVTATATLMDDLARDPRSLDLFAHKVASHASRPAPNGQRVLLIVDQFEELFTLCKDAAERTAFVDNLLAATQPDADGPITLVIAMRADFYAQCAQFDALRERLSRQQEYIGAMSQDELRRAIVEPARRSGFELEPGLADTLLKDAGDEPGALPLLSHALLETWKRREGRTLTLRGYADSGGLRGAIARTADSVYATLKPNEQAIARGIFLRLTELGEGAPDTRRRAALAELVPRAEDEASVRAMLKRLADARLVTTDEPVAGQPIAEVSHEALIREWPKLRAWLDEDRAGLRLQRQLSEDAGRWLELGRDEGGLYRGARLSLASDWAKTHTGDLNPLEREFVDASQALAQREREEREAQRKREIEDANRIAEEQRLRAEAEAQRASEQKRANVRLRQRAMLLAGALALSLALAVLAGLLARQASLSAQEAQANAQRAEQQRAEQQARIADARALAAQSISQLDREFALGLLLSVEADRMTHTAESRNSSIVAVQHNPSLSIHLYGHTARVWSVAFSPDGQTLASASDDNTIILWNVANPRSPVQLGSPLTGHKSSVSSVAFSPDGQTLASASADNTIILWTTDIEAWHSIACHVANRNLTWAEWAHYMGDRPYSKTCPNAPIHPSLLEEARQLAREGKLEQARARFRDLQRLAPELNPELEVRTAAVEAWLAQARSLAREGQLESARAKLKEARALQPDLPAISEGELIALRIEGLISKSGELAQSGSITQALGQYRTAIEMDPNFAAHVRPEVASQMAEQLNSLCWFGSVRGFAQAVLDICEKAVSLEPGDGSIRDSRGLALALTGDTQGAIKDFQAYVAWTDNADQRAQRQKWIEDLKAGRNPFDVATLKALQGQ